MDLQPVQAVDPRDPQWHDPQARVRLQAVARQGVGCARLRAVRALDQQSNAPAGPGQGVRRVQRLDAPCLGRRESRTRRRRPTGRGARRPLITAATARSSVRRRRPSARCCVSARSRPGSRAPRHGARPVIAPATPPIRSRNPATSPSCPKLSSGQRWPYSSRKAGLQTIGGSPHAAASRTALSRLPVALARSEERGALVGRTISTCGSPSTKRPRQARPRARDRERRRSRYAASPSEWTPPTSSTSRSVRSISAWCRPARRSASRTA